MTRPEHFTYVGGPNGQPTIPRTAFPQDRSTIGVGRANDTIGDAVGEQDSNAFHMTDAIDLHSGSSAHRVKVSDWMFRDGPEMVNNHTVIGKLGITLGDLQIAFVHQ